MVAHSRAPLRADRLRALNRPEPVAVACDERGRPLAVRMRGRKREVAAVLDRWRLDDEWWRRPIHRMYYLVETGEGALETLYQDLEDGAWYRQAELSSGRAGPA